MIRNRRSSAGAASLAGLLAAALAPAAPARAHPHVWVEADVALGFEGGRLAAVEMVWRFDELFSEWILGSHKAGPDGRFSPEAAAAIEGEAFVTLKEAGFLAHLRVDGAPVPLEAYRAFEPAAEGPILVYRFALPLPEPVDPRERRVTFGVYDEGFYVDVALRGTGEGGDGGQSAVSVRGEAPAGCRPVIREDAANPIYFGLVTPTVAEIACEGS